MSPLRPVLVGALAVTVLASCGVVSDPDLVASVEGVELTEDEFDALVREYTGSDDATEVDGDTARQIVGTFVGAEVLRADLAAMGVEPTEADTDLEGVQRLQNDFQVLAQTWGSLPAATTLDAATVERYEEGPESSGIVCAAHILVDTEAEADDVVEQLASGAEFSELAAEVSVDAGSAPNGGNLGCFTLERFQAQFIPEFVDAALAADIGVPTDPVESQFGWHVIELLPTDRIGDQDAFILRLGTFEDRYDIVIDPRFGQWDADSIIVPVT